MQTKGQKMTDNEVELIDNLFDIDFDFQFDNLELDKDVSFFNFQQLKPEIITGVEQGTLDWLELRKGKFTSSEYGTLVKQTKADEKADRLSKGAMTQVNKKVKETLYDFPDDDAVKMEFDGSISTAATDWGHTYEDTARKWYSKITTYDVKVPSFVQLGQDIGSSTDGLIYDNGVLEIKNHKEGTWHIKYLQINTQEELKELKFDYYAQCQGELFVTQREWCDFVSYDPRLMYTKNQYLAIKIIRIYPDIDFQKKLSHLLDKAINKRNQILESFEQLRPAF